MGSSLSRPFYGPSIQIDPSFPYYGGRTPDSIAEEIELAGFRSVHYFVVNEHVIQEKLIDAFHRRGMPVWAMAIGNGTFSTDRFPSDWPSWKMRLLKETNDGFERLSPFSVRYVAWKKAALARLAAEYPFDGIEIAEPYFPEWGGIKRGVYGDVGPLAQAAFRDRHGLEMPDFVNAGSPDYYLRSVETYRKWVDFRVEAVNGFLDELINGRGGVREARPGIAVATWSLAIDAGPDSIRRLREEQGLDAAAMVARVRPDMHVLQTHWPDWTRADLPADYVTRYQPFIDELRAQFPDLPLSVQADIGSARHMVKGGRWLSGFSETASKLGFSSWTAYEYHTGGYMYEEKPAPLGCTRPSKEEIVVTFNKRIDERSAASAGNYRVMDDGRLVPVRWDAIEVDGNRLRLRSGQLPPKPLQIELRGIRDAPDKWLFKEKRANTISAGTTCPVPGTDE
ncbi:N-acyl-D-glucosamine 2-epimerase [Paenibacillus sp. IB182493]|uniref:N-acyl-D-glucosamine 2-epimerase n=1 Tax=Paenibacillus arenilitoris TaxID=2772299 RepID=A0A927CQP3_9BACL|nr:N-acyl-D-glucosamine 2-epimerase [Paenibacillus arenilitoris]